MLLLTNLLGMAIDVGLLYYFYHTFLPRPHSGGRLLALCCAVDGLLYFACLFFVQSLMQQALCWVLFMVLPLGLYREKASVKLASAIVLLSIQCSAQLFALLPCAVPVLYDSGYLLRPPFVFSAHLLRIIIAKLIAALVICLITHLPSKKPLTLPVYTYVLLLAPICCAFALLRWQQYSPSHSIYAQSTLAALVLLVFNLLAFFLIAKENQVSTLQTQLAYEEELVQKQQQYHRSLAACHQETRQLYHDINNHFLILYDALTQNDPTKAMQYLQHQLQGLNHSRMVYTGYLLLDTVAFYKKQLADRQQTRCTVASALAPDLTLAEDLLNDFALIMAICLDNALEATARLAEPEARWITLSLRNDQTYLYLQLENSVAENATLSAQDLPPSTKENAQLHGLGLRQAQRLAERLQGRLLLECHDLVFTTSVMVKYHSLFADPGA